VARDTRGPVPVGHSDLRRFSLDPAHWRQARRMLGGEALVATLIGLAGLGGVYLAPPRGMSVSAVGLDVTPTLSWSLIGLGVLTAGSMLARRLAMVLSAVVVTASLFLVIICAVAATDHDPGPLGFTAAATVLYAVIFCANLAIGMWLVPNHIEGPVWLSRRRARNLPELDDSDSSSA
jgi:hypothetical protein